MRKEWWNNTEIGFLKIQCPTTSIFGLYMSQWTTFDQSESRMSPSVENRSTVRCICCCWTLYPKINFQPIRTYSMHVQFRGMTVGHVSPCIVYKFSDPRRQNTDFGFNRPSGFGEEDVWKCEQTIYISYEKMFRCSRESNSQVNCPIRTKETHLRLYAYPG